MSATIPVNRARVAGESFPHSLNASSIARELGVNRRDVAHVLRLSGFRVGRERRKRIVAHLVAIGVFKPRRTRTRITVGHSGCAK